MLALLIVVICVVALLTVLVVGLLRSHADILRQLHSLGAGVGDPAQPEVDATAPAAGPQHAHSPAARGTPDPEREMTTYGMPLPPDRSSAALDIVGVTPAGAAIAIPVNVPGRLTLLAFLSSGCNSCKFFWDELRGPNGIGLPPEVRTVVVAKGPDRELPADIEALAGPALTTIMSSEAWSDYEVPGSPFFALVDGDAGRRIGEGAGGTPALVADLVRRALADRPALSAQRAHDVGLDGPQREADNDRQLIEAGVLPGDGSLYPRTLADIFGGRDREAPDS